MILFALFLLFSGCKLLLCPEPDAPPPSGIGGHHWSIRAVHACVPLRWSPQHDGSCVAYDPSPPPARPLGPPDETDETDTTDATPALRRPLSLAFPRPNAPSPAANSSPLQPRAGSFRDPGYTGGGPSGASDRRCGGFGVTRLAVAAVGIVVCDLLFAFDSTPVMLSVTRVPMLLVASQV